MSDRDKVIRGLECCKSNKCSEECPYLYINGCIPRLCDDAVALLREQEPVKPTVDARDGWYRCGKCGNSLASGERVRSFGSHKWPVYCEMCGRAVKWDA